MGAAELITIPFHKALSFLSLSAFNYRVGAKCNCLLNTLLPCNSIRRLYVLTSDLPALKKIHCGYPHS